MNLYILCLRDIKANLYHPPIFVPNTMVLLRNLSDQVNAQDPKEDWQKHPEDFELLELGKWDSGTAEFDTTADVKQICVLSSLKG